MGSRHERQTLRALWRRCCFGLLLVVVVFSVAGVGCKSRKAKGVRVIYINRRASLGPLDEQALATARAEVDKWDAGMQVADHRVQRHSGGWTVSLLLTKGIGETGEAQYPEQPIRNVEINRAMEVLGYHASK